MKNIKRFPLFLFLYVLIFNTSLAADNCFIFSNSDQMLKRYKQWEVYLSSLPREELFDIIIGIKKPPKIITDEVRQQSNGMIKRIFSQLQLENREKPDRTIISWVRGFEKQSSIWTRKYEFNVGFSFGIITDQARKIGKNLILNDEISWNPKKKSHRICWKKSLNSTQRQIEILQTSSAPGTSRHHWGTDIDLFDPALMSGNWHPGQKYGYAFKLLNKYAHNYGFFRPYGNYEKRNKKGYLEEEWHWSYFPISRVFLDTVKNNQDAFEAHLLKHLGNNEKYSYVKVHWKEYVFSIIPMYKF